jgi:Beta-galactosidase/beta-glucuronidase
VFEVWTASSFGESKVEAAAAILECGGNARRTGVWRYAAGLKRTSVEAVAGGCGGATLRSMKRMLSRAWCRWAVGLAVMWGAVTAMAARRVESLEGGWEIADSVAAEEMPKEFGRTVPVPGLANLATPGFADVDRFISRENLANRIQSKQAPREWMREYFDGKREQERNYFWYRRTFRAPAEAREVARLRVNKAQFGTAVWLNGRKLGEYAGCFSASVFSLEDAIRWGEENVLVVRVGAHPAVLPDTFSTGSDFEKTKWTAGIYDRVAIEYCDNPAIESVQVAPRVEAGAIVVQTKVKNRGRAAVATSLTHVVRPWKTDTPVARRETAERLELAPGEERVVTETIVLPDARRWSPEDPFLYEVETSTRGDGVTTRFGLRDFRFSAETQRAHLNGEPIFLRGSNITLHRFFEDPLCGDLPWNDAWVRRLLEIAKDEMHWNYLRFCIGPVPERWLEICDELGLLIQNEFFVWTGAPDWYPGIGYSRKHDPEEMIRQYADWMRDNWNHPSVVVWDANNETLDPVFGEKVIPAVRPLDLSQRAWENSYNPPADPNDPIEYHPYLMQSGHRAELKFRMSDLETMDGTIPGVKVPWKNPALINEYGWLWLNRDGTPTLLTDNVYAQLLPAGATSRERLDLYAYLLAAKTEFWRAHRQFAGIIHFVYLTGSFPGVYTSDHFRDVRALELDPAFADYVGEAFKPLGVYVNFFQPTLRPGETREFRVKLVNDHTKPIGGSVALSLETKDGRVLAKEVRAFALEAWGAAEVMPALRLPEEEASDLVLRAVAQPRSEDGVGPTQSRRWTALRR